MFLVELARDIALLDILIMPVALPAIRDAFLMEGVTSIWILNIYQLSEAMTLLLCGPLSRRFGDRNIINTGCLIFCVGCIISGFSHTVGMLLLGRAIMGVGGALILPLGRTLIWTLFPPDRGMTPIIIRRLFFITLFLGAPVVAGLVIHYLNWQWIFWINIPLAVMCALGCYLGIKWQEGQSISYPYISAILALVGGGLLLTTVMQMKMLGTTSGWTIAGFIVSGLFITLYLLHSFKDRTPLVPIYLFKYPFFFLSMVQILFFSAAGALLTFWIIFFGYELNKAALSIGVFLFYCHLPLIALWPLSILAINKWGTQPVLLVLHLIWIFGILWMVKFYQETSFLYFLVPVICMASTYPIISSSSIQWVTLIMSHQKVGIVSSFFETITRYAGAIGLAVLTVTFAILSKHHQYSVSKAFWVVNGLGLILSVASMLLICFINKNQERSFSKKEA